MNGRSEIMNAKSRFIKKKHVNREGESKCVESLNAMRETLFFLNDSFDEKLLALHSTHTLGHEIICSPYFIVINNTDERESIALSELKRLNCAI